jgi:hypothetical protein
MSDERKIRMRLAELHCSINDVLEQIDEHAYRHADETLDFMQSTIGGLREGVHHLEEHALMV